MFSVRKVSIAFALAIAGVGMGCGTAAHAGVVVSATGPSAAQFPTGRKLDDNSRIVLKDGDRVTVLTAKGTRVISGAGTHQVGGAGASKRSTFAVLTRQRAGQRVRTGAVRGGPTTATTNRRNPNLWYVDVSQAGTICVADPAAIRLWRPSAQGETTLVIARANSSEHNHVSFAAGTADVAWDRERMPLVEGATYVLSGPDGAEREIRYTMLGTAPDDPEALAVLLIEKGCTAQLDLLTAAMS